MAFIQGLHAVQGVPYAAIVESKSGHWYVCGLPGEPGCIGPFASVTRATRRALKRMGRLPDWRVDVFDSGGGELVTYRSSDALELAATN
jgi:hypothetical protein